MFISSAIIPQLLYYYNRKIVLLFIDILNKRIVNIIHKSTQAYTF